MSVENELREAIAARRAVVVVGAGLSVAATDSQGSASWLGLIQNGIRYADEHVPNLPTGWRANVESDLEFAAEYPPALIPAAEKLMTALGGNSGGPFKAWLRQSVGKLEVVDPEPVDAVLSLECPTLTTNYDDLLSRGGGRSVTTWRDPSGMQMIVQGASRNIGHLHGHWEDGPSVILGAQAYGQIGGEQAAQAIERAVATSRSLIFVGFGAGLDDPNFDALRTWYRVVFGSSELQHYRICLAGEKSRLDAAHEGERILPVVAGASYGDIWKFLRGIAPKRTASAPSSSLQTAPSLAFDAVVERVRGEAILAEHLHDPTTCTLGQLLIPPVILPVTHQQFAASFDEPGSHLQRVEPGSVMNESPHLLLAGEENVGVSSALMWLVAERHQTTPRLAPVVVDFRRIGAGTRPLRRLIVRELRSAGVSISDRDPLPPLALAVDNLSTRPDRAFERVLMDLAELGPEFCVLGCRQGAEVELSERLQSAGHAFGLKYVGRLGRRDTGMLAGLVAPARAMELAQRALDIASSESLPRTPFTLALLLSAILDGESALSTASETALLDAYVSLLLGRGEIGDDSRVTLDSRERSDILSHLAETLVRAGVGSMPESEFIAALAAYFDDLGWNEDPLEVFVNLRRRRILVARSGQVQFQQSSYLHLFAGKRAVDSREFRDLLFARPIYFAPIVRHYAALKRNDGEAVTLAARLLGPYPPRLPASGGNFSDFGEFAADADMQQLLADGEAELVSGPDLDIFDSIPDQDRLPFPLDDIDSMPALTVLASSVALASSILRDSELVRDVELKHSVLRSALSAWGQLVDAFEQDPEFATFRDRLARNVADAAGFSHAKREAFVDAFEESAALLFALGGMSVTLSSRKLTRSLQRCFSDPGFLDDVPSVVMGALLAFDIAEKGWVSYFEIVASTYPRVRAVRTVLRRLGLVAYYERPLTDEDESRLLDYLVDSRLSSGPMIQSRDEKAEKARARQVLRRQRASSRRRPTREESPGGAIERGA